MWPFRFAMRNKRGLPNLVVYQLSSSPKNGVELMDGVEAMTRGWWRPTPGSIYPLLKEMSEQGIVKKRDDGKYELTEKGRSQFGGTAEHHRPHWPRNSDDMITQMNSFVSYMEDLKSSAPEDLKQHAGALSDLSKRISALTGKSEEEEGES
ncbi:MAG: PadR family transcriptional regulator [Nitrososphaerota archaeon]|nr:PadR family transcriptional regulator [Nitrososphaerota archaeon]